MLRKIFLLATTCLLVQVSFPGFSQEIIVRTYEGNDVPESYQDNYSKNFIRVNPFLGIRGAIVLGYERIVSKKHAIALDGGVTFREDMVYNYFVYDEIYGEPLLKPGMYLDLSYKYYFNGHRDFDKAAYLSPGVILRNYNIEVSPVYLGNSGVATTPDAGVNMAEVYLKLGWVAENFQPFIDDMYIGLGYRRVQSEKYEVISPNNNPESIREFTEVSSYLGVYFGVKFGLAF